MAAKTNAYRVDCLNVMRATNITAPAAVYLGAQSVLSSDGSSGGTDIAAATRQLITFTTAGSSGEVVNTSEILFPVASSNWGNVVGLDISSSSGSSGYKYYSEAFTAVPVSSGQQLKISSGSFTLQEI